MDASEGANRGSESRPVVIFLHIGKTGGSTLREVLNRNFPWSRIVVVRSRDREAGRLPREKALDKAQTLPLAVLARAELIQGAVVFGIHEIVPRPSSYITMMRDPVSLAVSQYRYVRRRRDHWLHDEASTMSLVEYVRSGVALEMDNSQTRALSGDRDTPFGRCSHTMLLTAKRNIDERFAAVGITERFDESLLVMRAEIGLSNIHYVRANAAPVGERYIPTPDAVELLTDLNRFDVELYRHAWARLDSAVARIDNFDSELLRFRETNSGHRRRLGESIARKARNGARRLVQTRVE